MASEWIRTEERGISIKVTVHVCNDCGRFCNVGQAIVHSKRCDHRDAQPKIDPDALTTPSARKAASLAAKTAAEIKRLGREGSGLTSEEIHAAHDRGYLTTSEAMNRDD